MRSEFTQTELKLLNSVSDGEGHSTQSYFDGGVKYVWIDKRERLVVEKTPVDVERFKFTFTVYNEVSGKTTEREINTGRWMNAGALVRLSRQEK